MTEKRFILIEYINKGLFIQDNANDETQYFQGSKASLEKVVDLLNSLNGENEQLKQASNEHLQEYTKLKKVCNTCKKENEKLKSEIKDLNDVLARYEEKELQKE